MDLTASTTYEIDDDQVIALVTPVIEKAVAALPPAKDGIDGKDGRAGADSTVPGPQGPQGPAGPAGSGSGYGLWLDSFAGKSDDERLDAALALAASGTVKRPILLANREYNFTTMGRKAASGTKLVQPYGFGNQQRGANSIPCNVRTTGAGAWFVASDSSTFDLQFSGFGYTSVDGKGYLLSSGGNTVWTSLFRDLGSLNAIGMFGSTTDKFLHTACAWDGWLNANNCRGTVINEGGSDSKFNWTEALIDAPAGYMPAGVPFIRLQTQQKTHMRGLYLTTDNGNGIIIDSVHADDGAVYLSDSVIEGRNAGSPSKTPLITLNSGRLHLTMTQLDFTAPGVAMIQQNGGYFSGSHLDFAAATGWDTKGPVLNQLAGSAQIGNVSSNWGGKPAVKGTQIITDASIAA